MSTNLFEWVLVAGIIGMAGYIELNPPKPYAFCKTESEVQAMLAGARHFDTTTGEVAFVIDKWLND